MSGFFLNKIFNSLLSKKAIKDFNRKYNNPRICLYGAGKLCEDFLRVFDTSELNIISIIDKDASKHGKEIDGYKICGVSELIEYNPDLILITLLCPHAVEGFLEEVKKVNALKFQIEENFSLINLLRKKYNVANKSKKIKVTFKNSFLLKKFIKKTETVKLHLGSGTNYFDGWINIDNNSDNNIEKLDFIWDLRKNLPIQDNSVDFIYNEHFLEHLSVEEGQKSLKDFLRVLKPTGVMRIAVPDLKDVVSQYLDDDWKRNNKESFDKFGLNFIKTRGELININFRHWGHKWLYDWEELSRRVKEAGATEVEKCEIFKSTHPDLNNLETRNESTLIVEIKK